MEAVKTMNDTLPKYTEKEEIFNMISHLVGVFVGLLTIITVILNYHSYFGFISGLIFGISMIFLYMVSSTYHGLTKNVLKIKKTFRIIDHCTIFVLIAGTYTPFALCVLGKIDSNTGWAFYAVIWSIAILGIALNVINMKKFKIISMILYLVMGFSLLLKTDVLKMVLGQMGFTFLLYGGVAYCVGIIFYILGSKKTWMHSVFHIYCIAGSVLHSICICVYVI